MRGLIENIQILIPIALFIAFRIIRSRSEAAKKQQKKTGGLGELIKKIQEAQQNPDYGKALTEDTEVYIPPKPLPQKKTAKKPQPKTVRQTKKPPGHSEYKPLFPETAKTPEQLSSETKVDSVVSVAARAASVAATSSRAGISLQGLTSLQQAVIWSEILGPPKGESIL